MTTPQILHLLTVDPALGRLDYDSLPDQALMEMIVEGMNPEDKKRLLLDENGNFKDIAAWDEDGHLWIYVDSERVIDFFLHEIKFDERQFPFEFVPAKVDRLTVSFCGLHGTLDTSVLPESLRDVDFTDNELHGSINFGALPCDLRELRLSLNKFSGACDLRYLPQSLVKLYLDSNEFSGEITLDVLPTAMRQLHLQSNELTGSIDTVNPPENMQCIDLRKNKFSGDVRILWKRPEGPMRRRIIRVDDNPLSGTAVLLPESESMRISFYGKVFTTVIDNRGNRHAWQHEFCRN